MPAAVRRALPRKGLWVFAYASLMWKPDFEYARAERALLRGYHRAPCMYSFHYRGTPEKPGLVFGLRPGGSCRGVAYNIAPENAESVTAYLHEREMINNIYAPKWLPVRAGEKTRHAWTFVADQSHEQYAGPLPVHEQARLIRQGRGRRGACLDYMRRTHESLLAMGVRDSALERVLHAAENKER
ncbi:MAG: gamma-glutamylcyclotransferase [Rhodospirillales bacterium]